MCGKRVPLRMHVSIVLPSLASAELSQPAHRMHLAHTVSYGALVFVPCAQVFRTYNASITLDRLLLEMEEAEEDAYAGKTVDAKKADYDRANKEVRWLAGNCGCCFSGPDGPAPDLL
jgi:hypothetical protein